VAGQNLEQVMAQAAQSNQPLAEEAVLGWMEQLADVLTYLHTRRPMVLHRDIKPANIKLTPEGRLKLVDFGLAKPFDPDDPRTVTGLQGLGSLPYTPLEQYVGHLGHTDARTDLYALGATCYHLLTGQVPPSAHDRFLNPDVLQPPKTLNPALSGNVSRAVLRAMALHPADRPASVADWLDALRFGSPEAADDQPDSLAAMLQQNAGLVVAALVLLIAALVITFGG